MTTKMSTAKYIILFFITAVSLQSCIKSSPENKKKERLVWKTQLQDRLSEFGHRNWILIVDKAFPLQNVEGLILIDTNEKLLDVLSYAMQRIDSSTHVKPIVFTDKELVFLTEAQIGNINSYRNSLSEVIGQYNPQVLLHDSVFVKIDQASKLFKVMVLKTNEIIPYSSVFIQLDCKYWSAEKEIFLREAMIKSNQ